MAILLKPVNSKKSMSHTGYFLYLLPKQSNYSKKCEAVNHVKLTWRGKGKEILIFVGIISMCAMLRLSVVSSLICSLFKVLGVLIFKIDSASCSFNRCLLYLCSFLKMLSFLFFP